VRAISSQGDLLLTVCSGAGADTVSIAMRTCVHAICQHPEVYQKLQSEVDEFYYSNNLSSGITYLQTQSLPYLVAVCKEAMRLFPSIVFQLPRHLPAGGISIGDKYIPGSCEVGVSPLAQNRDTAIWGLDADEFKPERWLESEERSRYLDGFNMTFGGNGPRMCIGRNIALVSTPLPLAGRIAYTISLGRSAQVCCTGLSSF